MQKLSIFISSPGDVGREREVTRKVIGKLGAELGDTVTLSPYFWEYEPVVLTKDYQEQIPPPSTFDIFICILWSRLGTRLHSSYKLPPDHVKVARSGTEFEFVDAALAVQERGVPDILVWRNTSKPLADISAKDRDERLRQWDQLQAFLDEWTRDQQEQVFRGALNEYKTLDEFEDKLEVKLRKVIQQRLHTEVEPRPHRTWEGNPFRGLHYFDFEHAPIFFGRTRAIGQVLEHLERQNRQRRSFVLVLGASGSGKSSLVRAGVLPLLVRPGTVDGIGLWKRAVMRPSEGGTDPFDALAAALLRDEALPRLADRSPDAEKAREALAIKLRENPAAVAAWVESALQAAEDKEYAAHAEMLRHRIAELNAESRVEDVTALHQRLEALQPPNIRLVLVVDQMEELFTTGVPQVLRLSFLKALRDLATSGRISVLATLRSDFFGKCEESPDLMWLKEGDGTCHLPPPTPAELGQMIREPARAAGALYEETVEKGRLDERIQQAALYNLESLPLVEHCLDELYAKCGADGLLTHAEYEALGELEGVLASRAGRTLAECLPDAQTALPDVLSRLVAAGAGEQETPVRRVALWSEFDGNAAAQELVQAFIHARLFTTTKDAADRPTVAITHEALLGRMTGGGGDAATCASTAPAGPGIVTDWRWKEFGDWWEQNRDFLRRRASMQEARRAWEASQKDRDYLLHGRALADAEDLQHRHAVEPDDAAFIRASASVAREQTARSLRKRNWTIAVLSLLTVSALALGIAAWLARNQAIEARGVAVQNKRFALKGLNAFADEAIPLSANVSDSKERVRTERLLEILEDGIAAFPASSRDDDVKRLEAIALTMRSALHLQDANPMGITGWPEPKWQRNPAFTTPLAAYMEELNKGPAKSLERLNALLRALQQAACAVSEDMALATEKSQRAIALFQEVIPKFSKDASIYFRFGIAAKLCVLNISADEAEMLRYHDMAIKALFEGARLAPEKRPNALAVIAAAHSDAAMFYTNCGEPAKAAPFLRAGEDAITEMETAAANSSKWLTEVADWHFSRALELRRHGDSFKMTGDSQAAGPLHEKARVHFEKELQIRRKVHELESGGPALLLARSLRWLASLQSNSMGQHDSAIGHCREAVSLLDAILQADPSSKDALTEQVEVLELLSFAASRIPDRRTAVWAAEQAVALQRRVLALVPPSPSGLGKMNSLMDDLQRRYDDARQTSAIRPLLLQQASVQEKAFAITQKAATGGAAAMTDEHPQVWRQRMLRTAAQLRPADSTIEALERWNTLASALARAPDVTSNPDSTPAAFLPVARAAQDLAEFIVLAMRLAPATPNEDPTVLLRILLSASHNIYSRARAANPLSEPDESRSRAVDSLLKGLPAPGGKSLLEQLDALQSHRQPP